MRYGRFDDAAKEYIIDRPDTPRSWQNYIGSRAFGGIITNNAGGYSFYRSAARGRFLRWRFNSIPMDQPGRYFYLRDREDGDYWSNSWQPVGKPLDQFKSTCRFGTSYAIFSSEYRGIHSESTYFVPLGQDFEYWRLKVRNDGPKRRDLGIFTYCEFSSEWNIFQDSLNLQYSSYCVQTEWRENMIRCSSLNNLPPDPANFYHGDQGRWSWMSMVGSEVAGYDTDRERFIGTYRSFHNPLAVERGYCENSLAYGDSACGGIHTDISLEPGEEKEILILLGVGKAEKEGVATRAEFGTLERATLEFGKLKKHWHDQLGSFVVESPDEDFNHMINVWNAYNALITFHWSRAASLVYTGEDRDGFGYRDGVQDVIGVTHALPGESRERLELFITAQESTGGARVEVKPLVHRPGHMPLTNPDWYRSDDALWLFNSIPAYVAETGDTSFYFKVLPYSDKGEATVLAHLRHALQFNLDHMGAHGLPCGLLADWNDCLKLGRRGESVFVAFQLRFALNTYADIATLLSEPSEASWARAELEKLDANIQVHAWDGKWFVRAIREDGVIFGSATQEEGKIFLNPQSWAVISGSGSAAQWGTAMDSVEERLSTDFGLMLCSPAYRKVDHHVMRAVLFNPGQKENGGIFSHPQGWAVMADCMLGNGDRAYRNYRAYMPSRFNDMAEVREIEPFVHCQSTNSPESPRYGASRLPWLTGTAAWSFYSATQYILGIRPEIYGLRIDPCIPSAWKGFRVDRTFRGKRITIHVKNPHARNRGVREIRVNGTVIAGNLLPVAHLADGSVVEVTLEAVVQTPAYGKSPDGDGMPAEKSPAPALA